MDDTRPTPDRRQRWRYAHRLAERLTGRLRAALEAAAAAREQRVSEYVRDVLAAKLAREERRR